MLRRNAIERGAQIAKSKGTVEKRRPPCRHGGLESREETPKEGICGRSCRTATISPLTAAVASVFFVLWMTVPRIRSTVAFVFKRAYSDETDNHIAISMI
jgi:hypothetical protein